MDRWASIKIGSTSVNLVVTEISETELSSLVYERRIVKLSSGIYTTGNIDPEAMERCLVVLKEYAHILEATKASRLWVVGTSVLRQAKNASTFIDSIARHLGWQVVCISGETEANLSYLGSTSGIEASDMLVIDVGGGSTEIIVGHKHQPLWTKSLDVGALNLTEAFLKHDPILPAEYAAMMRYIEDVLSGHLEPQKYDELTVVGVGGSVTAIALLDLGLDGFDEHQVHGHRLTVEAIKRIQDKLVSQTIAQRAEFLVEEKKRAGIIVAGIAVILGLAGLLNVEEIVVSAHGVNLGIIRAFKEAPSLARWIEQDVK